MKNKLLIVYLGLIITLNVSCSLSDEEGDYNLSSQSSTPQDDGEDDPEPEPEPEPNPQAEPASITWSGPESGSQNLVAEPRIAFKSTSSTYTVRVDRTIAVRIRAAAGGAGGGGSNGARIPGGGGGGGASNVLGDIRTLRPGIDYEIIVGKGGKGGKSSADNCGTSCGYYKDGERGGDTIIRERFASVLVHLGGGCRGFAYGYTTPNDWSCGGKVIVGTGKTGGWGGWMAHQNGEGTDENRDCVNVAGGGGAAGDPGGAGGCGGQSGNGYRNQLGGRGKGVQIAGDNIERGAGGGGGAVLDQGVFGGQDGQQGVVIIELISADD